MSRRSSPAFAIGGVGPQLRQTSNAYWLDRRSAAAAEGRPALDLTAGDVRHGFAMGRPGA